MTAKRRLVIERLLSRASAAQTEFWNALSALEREVGDLDGIGDLGMYDADSILGYVEEHNG